MTAPVVDRDERTMVVENAGYKLSYLALSYGILAIVAYRSFEQAQQSWDLLALVVLGGGVNAGYQARHGVLYKRWAVITGVTIAAAALLAAVMVWLRP